MTVRDIHWASPLKTNMQSGIVRKFSSVYETLDFLENEWPVKNGNRYSSAIAACRGALDRTIPAAVARDAFVGACYEAGVAIVASTPLHRPPPEHRTAPL